MLADMGGPTQDPGRPRGGAPAGPSGGAAAGLVPAGTDR